MVSFIRYLVFTILFYAFGMVGMIETIDYFFDSAGLLMPHTFIIGLVIGVLALVEDRQKVKEKFNTARKPKETESLPQQ